MNLTKKARSKSTLRLLQIGFRYLFAHRLQSLLMLLGITLGVAVALSVDVANTSAETAFELSTQAINGRSSHYISGGPSGINEENYTMLRKSGLEIPMAPVISQFFTSPQIPQQSLQLLGVDPLAEAPFRNYFGFADLASTSEFVNFYTREGAILISDQLSVEHNLSLGDEIQIILNGKEKIGFIAGIIQAQDPLSAQGLKNIVLADISTVQELSERIGMIDRIDLILPANQSAESIANIKRLLPANLNLLAVEGQNQVTEQLTTAFRTNLTALSLLALLVGLFLIYNTMTFSIIQRRKSFGTLRALGVTSKEIFQMVLVEAFVVGILGSILGLGLGVLMGRGAIELVSQTINDVFFTLTVQSASIPSDSFVKGALLGVGATLLATIGPAWEAAKSPARKVLSRAHVESISVRLINLFAKFGILLILSSALLLTLFQLGLNGSFAATFTLVIGFAVLSPWITIQLMPSASRILERIFGPVGKMAPREVANSASRTSLAMAALMVAVAVTIGVSLMVSSFRQSVSVWLDQILRHDIYVSVAGESIGEPSRAIDPDIINIFNKWEGVEEQFLLRNVQIDSSMGAITVSSNNNPNDGEEQILLSLEGSPQEAWEAVKAGAVFISEPLANRLQLDVGDNIQLNTNNGPRDFHISAIFTDYASSGGTVSMWLPNYQTLWNDIAITAFSLKVAPSIDLDGLIQELQLATLSQQDLVIRSNRNLRETSLQVFDRTFTITSALQVITTSVAFIGVMSSMLSLQVEKQSQLGILKAIGMSTRQLWTLVMLETGIIGLLAALIAMPTGYAVALILVRIINVQSFGWSMELFLEINPFIQAMLVSIGAALLAGLYPAYRISRRKASDAMRFD